ncbi:uncharacterized protein LOC106091898 [Stomoxys calcitrans]|uniref:uncharacterized protein LOC106091898 n=1 Tax=Stomoxys calcitrans TaxID=35570 RepID=UPI0027E280CB|nr:uncharacterized protein LOC106091898 [Stomoxys calcitrans]
MTPNPNNSLSEDDDIEIRVITEADSKKTWDLMSTYFFPDEPLAYSSEPRNELLVGKAHKDHGTCLMAVLKSTNGIVGVCICGPKGPEEAEHMQKDADAAGKTKWGKIFYFLAKLERDANVY